MRATGYGQALTRLCAGLLAALAFTLPAPLAAQWDPVADYGELVTARIYRHWRVPPTVPEGAVCKVRIVQADDGAVRSATPFECDAHPGLAASVTRAVQQASPLPLPPDPKVFRSTLVIVFRVDKETPRLRA
jgi:hypothetical protein